LQDRINRSVFNNLVPTPFNGDIPVEGGLKFDKRIGLGPIAALTLTRSFSSDRSLEAEYNPESLALEHINSGKPTTSSVINQILLNQNLSVNDSKLEELLKVKGVEIDLPITTPENKKLLDELTGKSQYKGFSGVYIFIHKKTGNKYVGSSNLLRRRMEYYFKGDYPSVGGGGGGKFLPLLRQEGLKAFKLVIFKLDSSKFSNRDAIILEQYYLLNKEFNLNTLRVVNAGSSKPQLVTLYMFMI